LRHGDGEQAFAFATPAGSWKRFLHPPRRLLLTATTDGDELRIDRPEPERSPANLAFLGVRACDLAGLQRLDQALDAPPGPSPRHHRPGASSPLDEVFIVAVACGHPSDTCFCVSQATGPRPGPGHDLEITELDDHHGHEFLIEAGTDRGRAVLVELAGRTAVPADHDRAAEVVDRAASAMVRRIEPTDPPAAGRHLDHPRWDDVADRCLACANCTLVCPTCFCSSVEDSTDVAGTTAFRHQVWDSCFGSSFSELGGIPVRSTTGDRYRQWLLHKLVTWHDQFDVSGCVGCGRCITWCPVGIDLTAEVAALARRPGETGSSPDERPSREERP
jgi:ferredoxin